MSEDPAQVIANSADGSVTLAADQPIEVPVETGSQPVDAPHLAHVKPLSVAPELQAAVAKLIEVHGHELRGFAIIALIPANEKHDEIWRWRYWPRRRHLMAVFLEELADLLGISADAEEVTGS